MISMNESTINQTFVNGRLNEVLSINGDIHERLGGFGVEAVAYNTGWAARITDPEGNPEFPKAIDWLVANQYEDGSWGSHFFQGYDRFLNTLSAAIALKQWGNHPEQVAMAEAYITKSIDDLTDHEELRGSDHLVAVLIEEARNVGLNLPYERSPHKPYGVAKRIYMSYVYAKSDHPMGFYTELLGRVPTQKRIVKKTMMGDGSLCSDTATTAASLVFDRNPRMDHSYYDRLRFLNNQSLPDGGVRHFGDYELMERAYDLYHLMWVRPRSQLYIDNAMALFKDHWTEDGITFSNHFIPPDLDNTGMAYRVLTELGHEPDPHSLDNYWKGDHWVVYIFHDRPPAAANLHALEAIAVSSHPDREHLIDATLKYLRRLMIDGNHFIDEWHLSPAYPTSHAIRAFHLTEETLMERCLSFFLDNQNEDGSWGFIGNGLGTLEETGFALQGLLYYHQEVEPIDPTPIHKGVEYILDRYPPTRFPPMWVAKVLYCPVNIIEGVIEGALLMYQQNFGGGHGNI